MNNCEQSMNWPEAVAILGVVAFFIFFMYCAYLLIRDI